MVVIGRDGTQKKKPVPDDTVIQVAPTGKATPASPEGEQPKCTYKWFVGRRGEARNSRNKKRRMRRLRVALMLQAALMLILSTMILRVVGLDNNSCSPQVMDATDKTMVGLCRMARYVVYADMLTVHACLILLMVDMFYTRCTRPKAHRG